MADQTNDTQGKINEEDRNLERGQQTSQGQKADDFQGGSSGMPGGGEAEGQFARQGESAMGGSLGSSANQETGAGGAQTGTVERENQAGSMSGTSGSMQSGSPGGQSAGSVGTIGGNANDTGQSGEFGEGSSRSTSQSGSNEYGAQGQSTGQDSPLGASHQNSADGGSVTAAGSSSTGPGAGQAGTDRSGFIGAQSDDSDPQQAGFAEQGRGAADEGGQRTDNEKTDIEGSSQNR